MSNDFANPRCSLCGSLLHFTDQHPDPTPPLTAERERDLAFFRARWPRVGAHDIPNWFADGAAYGRAEERAARAQVLEVLRVLVEATDQNQGHGEISTWQRWRRALASARALLDAEDARKESGDD